MADQQFIGEAILRDAGYSEAAAKLILQNAKLADSGVAVADAVEREEKALQRAEKAAEAVVRRYDRLTTAAERRDRDLRKLLRAQNLAGEGDEKYARTQILVREAFERTERALRGNSTEYEKLRNRLDSVAGAQREFANTQEIISLALQRGEISAKDNAEEIAKVERAALAQLRASQQQLTAFQQLEQSLDPLVRVEREYAASLTTVSDALRTNEIDGQRAKEVSDELRASKEREIAALDKTAAEYEALRASLFPTIKAEQELAAATELVNRALAAGRTDQVTAQATLDALEKKYRAVEEPVSTLAKEFENLEGRLFPLIAAQRRFDEGAELVSNALREQVISSEQAGAAMAQLQVRLDAETAAAQRTKNEFSELEARLDPVVRAHREFARDAEIVSVALQREEISAEQAARAMTLLNDRLEQAKNGQDRFNQSAARGDNTLRSAQRAYHLLTAAAVAFGSSLAVRKLVEYNDTLQRIENRLRVVIDSNEELTSTQAALFAASDRTFTRLEGSVEVYERLKRSTKELNIENDRLLRVTELVNKAIALSGTNAQSAQAALVQFGQGLAADSLRGQELNSVFEQTPRLAIALAQGLGLSLRELRQLANDGLLGAVETIEAIENAGAKLEEEFSRITPTLDQTATVAENAATKVGAAFSRPVLDDFKAGLLEVAAVMSDPDFIAGAERAGQGIADGLANATLQLRILSEFAQREEFLRGGPPENEAFSNLFDLGAERERREARLAELEQLNSVANRLRELNALYEQQASLVAGVRQSLDESKELDEIAFATRQIKEATGEAEEAQRRIGKISDETVEKLREHGAALPVEEYEELVAALELYGNAQAKVFAASIRSEQERQREIAAFEKLGAVIGVTAAQSREIASSLGLIDIAEALPEVPVERFGAAIDRLAARFDTLSEARDRFGNGVDLTRPRIDNADGTFSTEETFTTESDGRFLNIPTIFDGERHTIEEAWQAYVDGANEAVGVFNTLEEAIAAAEQRTEDIGALRIDEGAGDALAVIVGRLREIPDAASDVKTAFSALGDAAVDEFSRIARAVTGVDELRGFEAALKTLQGRVKAAQDEALDVSKADPEEILGILEKQFPRALENNRDAVNELIAALKDANKDAGAVAENLQRIADEERTLENLRKQAEAARGGPDALAIEQKRQAIEEEIIKRRRAADEANLKFFEEEERARLRQFDILEEQRQRALAAFDELLAKQDAIREGVVNDFERTADRLGRAVDPRALAGAPGSFERQRALVLQEQLIKELQDRFDRDEVGLASFEGGDDFIEDMKETLDEFIEDQRDAAEYGSELYRRALQEETSRFISEGLSALFFEGGKGFSDFLKGVAQGGIEQSIFDPIGDFLSGESEDLFGGMLDGFNDSIAKFEKAGGELGKVFGAEGLGGQLGGGLGGGLIGFEFGDQLADLIGLKGNKASETAGGVAGGAIGFAIAGPLGAAIGAGLGRVLAGLVSKPSDRTAQTAFDIDTGVSFGSFDEKAPENAAFRDELAATINEALARALDITGGQVFNDPSTPANEAVFNLAVRNKRGSGEPVIDFGFQGANGEQFGGGRFDATEAGSEAVVSKALQLALGQLSGAGEFGEIAKGLSAANVPAEELLATLETVSQVFELTKPAASEFGDTLETVIDVFDEAARASGDVAKAERELAEARLDTLTQLGKAFDEDVERQLIAARNPQLGEALDLAETQLVRAQDAEKINAEIEATIANLAAGAKSSGEIAELNAEMAARVEAVNDLNAEEWRQFIESAGDSPDAFQAAAQAIEQMRDQAIELGIDFATLEDQLESVRASLATDFDETQARRRLELENPLGAQAQDLIEEQIAAIETARLVSANAEDMAVRLQEVFSINALEIEEFISAAETSPEAIQSIIDALDILKARADEVGLTVAQIEQFGVDAIAQAGQAFLEQIQRDTRGFANEPLANFQDLLEAQRSLIETADKLAELDPDRFSTLPGVVQDRNALEREKFFEALSDEDKLRLGDFLGLIEDFGGRIAVVTTQLRDTIRTRVDDINDALEEAQKEFELRTSLAEGFADTRQELREEFFPGNRLEALSELEARVNTLFEDTLAGNESAARALPQVAAEFLRRSREAFGSTGEFDEARSFIFDLLAQAEEAQLEFAAEAKSTEELLTEQIKIEEQILKALESGEDNTAYLSGLLDEGKITNDLIAEMVAELVSLKEQQAGQNLNVVNRLAAIDMPEGVTQLAAADFASIIPANDTFLEPAPDLTGQQEALAQQVRATADAGIPDQANVPPPLSSPSTGKLTIDQTEVIMALSALNETMARNFGNFAQQIKDLKEEVRQLRGDAERQSEEEIAATRTAGLRAA